MYHIHAHTEFSNAPYLDAIMKVTDLPKFSAELGARGVTITDHEIVAGHLKFLESVREIRKSGETILKENPNSLEGIRLANFKGILGNEIYLTKEGQSKDTHETGDKFYHFVLLAKDKMGWEQLNELSSIAWDRKYIRAIPRRPTYLSDLERVVGENQGHVIGTTACLGSWLGNKILAFHKIPTSEKEKREGVKSEIVAYILKMIEIFGRDNFFLELQPGQSNEQKIYNQGLVAFGKLLDVKTSIGIDAHYSRPELKGVHEAFLNSQEAERETASFYDYTYLMTEEEQHEFFSTHLNQEDIQNAFQNTEAMGDSVEVYAIEQDSIIPLVPVVDRDKWEGIIHKYDSFEWFKKFSHSEYEEDRFLLYNIITMFDEKLKIDWVETSDLERINEELKDVHLSSEKLNQRMSAYFTTFKAIVEQIWKVSIVAPGRGSAGAFLINFVLDITQIHPLRQAAEMPSWRFISAEKASLADIDIDSGTSARGKILQQLSDYFLSFGSKLVSIATFGTEKSKSALITSARGLGLETEEGLYFSSLVPSERGFLWDLADCYHGNESKNRKPIKEFVEAMNENPKVWEVAQQIEGLISRSGSHAAGIAIFNDGRGFSQTATMRTPSGTECTQFSLEDLEKVGVVKYDLLSTAAIDAIQTELYMLTEDGYIEWEGSLKATYWRYFHPNVLEYKAKEMWDLIHEKKVLGLFQFHGSPVGEVAIDTIRPTDLLELATINSVMRLMAADGAEMPLVQYRHRKENINIWYNEMAQAGLNASEVALMEKHMAITRGMCITQEQLMIMLMDKEIANFTFLQADKARKIIGKKKMDQIETLKEEYFERGRSAGVSDRLLHYVWYNAFAIQLGYSFSNGAAA